MRERRPIEFREWFERFAAAEGAAMSAPPAPCGANHQGSQPEIDPDRCLHALSPVAKCHACADACPRTAWLLDDQALRFDAAACDGCGLCVPACPEDALALERRAAIRVEAGSPIALIACAPAMELEGDGVLACVHALGWRDLMALRARGALRLAVATADCDNCPRGDRPPIENALGSANRLLTDRGLAPMTLCKVDAELWQRARDRLPVASARPGVSRRRMLGLTRPVASSTGLLDSRPDRAQPAVPSIDLSKCTGCDTCAKSCPHAAIRLVRDQAGSLAYEIVAERCSGCDLCEGLCDVGAITIGRFVRPSVRLVPLSEAHCRACGRPYHTPLRERADDRTCPTCASTKHASALYQVLK